MALQDTPPLADPTTGRIPPYTQVLKQDPITGTYKIKYDVKAAPPASALQTGLTTPTTTLPGQMYGTGTQDGEDETDTDAGTDAQTNINTAIATTQNRGGEGMGRDRDFGGISVGEQSIADLSSTLNPSNFESTIFAGITAMTPMAIGGLIAAGSADAQRQAIREINRRAAAGTLGTNPDGSQVSDQALASLGQQIGNQYGLPGFTSALNNTAAGQIFAANLAPQSLTGEETFNVTNQMVNPVSQEQITRDFDQAMMLGFQENQEQNLRDVFAQDIARQTMDPQAPTNIGATLAAADEAAGVQTGDASAAEAEAQAGSGANYGWNSTDGSTMTSNSTTTNADGSTTTNLSGLNTANQVVSEGTGGPNNHSQNQVNNAQNQINGAVQEGGPSYGMAEGVSAVGYGYNSETGNYSGTVSYSGGTVTTGQPEGDGGNNANTGGQAPSTGVSGVDADTGKFSGGKQEGSGGDGPCFLAGTLITMADETKKPIEEVELMDKVAIGGYVGGVGKFLTDELYDYNGVKVSGSHLVNEDNKWMHVKDSKNGKPLGNDTHVVYVLGTEHRRLLIENILFTDYLETKEQEMFIAKGSDYFFNNHGSIGNKIAEENLKILNAEN
tara:strand:+ start:573 stop:2411 length:1839 start_codon:yes stop_codon:yes gene_type:complete